MLLVCLGEKKKNYNILLFNKRFRKIKGVINVRFREELVLKLF